MTDSRAATNAILHASNLLAYAPGGGDMRIGDLTLGRSELHVVYSPLKSDSTAIADALLGLSGTGDVRFQGQAWANLSRRDTGRLRGRIGRVLSEGNWLENRSVMENLLLPLRHQTVLPEPELREMASELALRFDLPGIPLLLPHQCPASDLERVAIIRALMARPELLVLEHPLESSGSRYLSHLIGAVQQVRRRRGAVIWFAHDAAVLEAHGIAADRRYRVAGSRMIKLEAA